ncbi:DUF1413 domain-containing protein [Planococcus halocryophilus]|uniref:DUF1413 domain-containing protein n=1 Tax=Planococcus halocryophilus TaxID=1215089 RepID=UPI001F0DBEEA|nr:DUF1413 domain-containing protein [Planococcus halocryophilus]MCH4826640.1 single-stranded DNA-binding protein [Planococcus halocryophilus]
MKLVKLNLTENEYANMYSQAVENGYASVPDYLRYLLFNAQPDVVVNYDELLKQFAKAVSQKKDTKEFKVRDCFEQNVWKNIDISARRNLGRMIMHKVEKDNWLSIVPTKKDSGNAQWYKRGDK